MGSPKMFFRNMAHTAPEILIGPTSGLKQETAPRWNAEPLKFTHAGTCSAATDEPYTIILVSAVAKVNARLTTERRPTTI